MNKEIDKNIAQLDALLEKTSYVIDFLPEQVPENTQGRYFDIEQYFLNGKELKLIAKKFKRILLKLLCYYRFELQTKECLNALDIETLLVRIEQVVVGKVGTINILIPDEATLICIEGGSLNMTVYNPSTDIKRILSALATSEGLFWWKCFN